MENSLSQSGVDIHYEKGRPETIGLTLIKEIPTKHHLYSQLYDGRIIGRNKESFKDPNQSM